MACPLAQSAGLPLGAMIALLGIGAQHAPSGFTYMLLDLFSFPAKCASNDLRHCYRTRVSRSWRSSEAHVFSYPFSAWVFSDYEETSALRAMYLNLFACHPVYRFEKVGYHYLLRFCSVML